MITRSTALLAAVLLLTTAAPPPTGINLRGDKYLGGYGYADIRALAGRPGGDWRRQFVELTRLADHGTAVARAD